MRVALYERVSTEEQSVHGLSIEAQKAALGEWAKDKRIVDHYTDLGISARLPILKRPQLQRLLRDVEAGRVDIVAYTKLDRWTRNIREYYKAQDVLDAHGVAWRAVQEDYETETAAGRLKVNIMLAIAQDEADRTSERVKAVFEEKRRKGLTVNGHMPPGLDYANGHIVPNEDAPKIKALFESYLATRTLHSAAYAAKGFLGRQYSTRGIKQLLTNEKYLSSGIVPQDVWDAVQYIIHTRATRTVRSGRVYLFSGILKCPECGNNLTVRTRQYKDAEYIYYRCDKHDQGRRCGYNRAVRERELEAYLLRRILPEIEGYNLTITKAKKKPVDVPKLQKKLDKLTDLYLDALISKDEYDERSTPLRDAISAAQSAPRPIDKEEIIAAVDVYPTLSKAAQKAFWSALVKSVVPAGKGFKITFFN